MISSLPQLSDTLQRFYSFVESESGRTISLQQAAFVGLQGMNFAFAHHPTDIVIEYVLPFNGTIDQLEEALSHEAGHGLLTYGRGYTHLELKQKTDNVAVFSLSVIATMIDDVPVNKLIQDHGFRTRNKSYARQVSREAKFARRKDMSIYRNTGPNDLTVKRFGISRYVSAWTCLQYLTISSDQRDALRKFRKNFKRAYPDLYREGLTICEHFKAHDVFTSTGHENILKNVVSLWNLSDYVNFKRGWGE